METLKNSSLSEECIAMLIKLATLGQQLSVVAHELNNVLTGIAGFTALANRVNRDKQVAYCLLQANNNIARAARLLEHLMDFPRQHPAASAIRLDNLLDDILAITKIKKHIVIAKDIEPIIITGQHQDSLAIALLNLVKNAAEAMDRNGGTLRITGMRCPDGTARVFIEDDGYGIPADMHGCVFDPFFSTKTGGHGIGLYISRHEIVEKIGGQMCFESMEGAGTIFKIALPQTALAETTATTH